MPKMWAMCYPDPDPDTWEDVYADSLRAWHAANHDRTNQRFGFYVPGTTRFDSLFAVITGTLNNEQGGTAFYDKSALWHNQAEYIVRNAGWPDIRLGASYRAFLPDSRGTIFSDTAGTRIRNHEWGAYAGFERKFLRREQLIASATLRLDKNANLPLIHTEAAGLVWQPFGETYLRTSFSTGLRNPTLSDQYLWLNVGPAILAGHVGPVDSLITLASFDAAREGIDWSKLVYFTIDRIRPEQVRTLEFGFRSRIAGRWDLDGGYYHNWYKDFLGYLIGLTAVIDVDGPPPQFPDSVKVYRYSANSGTRVRTQGASLALSYRLGRHITLGGNGTWNALVKSDPNDPIIPAFNTPPFKYNLQIAGYDLPVFRGAWAGKAGFLVNYRHVTGFRFEGSPQFQGDIPSYGLVDAQVNLTFDRKPNVMIKVGASNLLDNRHLEAYGGPRIGRLAFVQVSAAF
jgi:outer membrane receptor protein involved in Fe transport